MIHAAYCACRRCKPRPFTQAEGARGVLAALEASRPTAAPAGRVSPKAESVAPPRIIGGAPGHWPRPWLPGYGAATETIDERESLENGPERLEGSGLELPPPAERVTIPDGVPSVAVDGWAARETPRCELAPWCVLRPNHRGTCAAPLVEED